MNINYFCYVYVFVISLLISLFLTPLVKIFATRYNFVDRPSNRKIHTSPIPLFGGIAIILAFYSSFLLMTFCYKLPLLPNLPLIIGGFVLIVLGIWDALLGTQPYVKMGLLFLIAFGVAVVGNSILITPFLMFNIIFTTFWIAGVTNAFNYLDNMDGLSAGLAFISSVLFFIVSFVSGQQDLAVLSLALAGGTLGFLKYNFNPASIFMGDVGSYFIGFVLAIIGSRLVLSSFWDLAMQLHIRSLQSVSYVVPVLILAVPIFDTFLVTIMRPLAKRRIVQAGKDHSSHRLHHYGFSQKATVLILYGLQLVLGACAIILMRARLEQFVSIVIIVSVMIIFCWLFLAKVEVYSVNALSGDFFDTP